VARLRGRSRLGRRSRRAALAVLDQGLVELLLLHAARQNRVRTLQLRVDHRLERLVRHRARHARAVDEEVRGSVGSQFRRLGLVVADDLGGLGRVHVALVALHVEADLARHGVHLVLLERVLLAGVVRLEQLVVHLPELALLVRGDGRLGRVGSVRVHGQRVVLEDEPDVGSVAPLDLVQRVDDAAAERTLEVRPLDDGHLGLGAALLRRVTDGDLVDLVGTRRPRRRSGNGLLRVAERSAETCALRHLVADGEPRDGTGADGDKDVPIALHVIPFSSLPDGRPAKTSMKPPTPPRHSVAQSARRNTTSEARASAFWTSRSADGGSLQVATRRKSVPRSSMRTKYTSGGVPARSRCSNPFATASSSERTVSGDPPAGTSTSARAICVTPPMVAFFTTSLARASLGMINRL